MVILIKILPKLSAAEDSCQTMVRVPLVVREFFQVTCDKLT